MTNLATPEEVADISGRSVDASLIARAQAMIEDVTGVDLSVDTLETSYRSRDLRLLKRAVVWQTAYLDINPDVMHREANLTSASTNGNSKTWGEGGSGGGLISPFAEANLRRLSWRRTRAIRLRKHDARPMPQTLVSDGYDSEWRPLR